MADERLTKVTNLFPDSIEAGLNRLDDIQNTLGCTTGDAVTVYVNLIQLVTKRVAYEEQAQLLAEAEAQLANPGAPVPFGGLSVS